jgi:hypothetical protein
VNLQYDAITVAFIAMGTTQSINGSPDEKLQ